MSAQQHDSRRRQLGRLGVWCSIPSPYIVEILARADFDWLCLDMQHGFIDRADLLPLIQVATLSHKPVLVRVNEAGADILHALDAGATGVIVPMVDAAADAEAAVRMCRYPPHGTRSWARSRGSLLSPDYTSEWANDQTLCIVMIETTEGIENLDSILAVDGLDAIFVGPSDLAVSMLLKPDPWPIPGEHEAALADVARRCRQHGMAVGTFAGTFGAVSAFESLGYTFVTAATDIGLIKAGVADGLHSLNAGHTIGTTPLPPRGTPDPPVVPPVTRGAQ